jgi:hypothetical protein
MKVIYRNPVSHKVEDLLIGETKLRVDGWYNDGCGEEPLSGGGFTAPSKPDFEIEKIELVIPSERGEMLLDITKLIDDLNTLSWRKECSNDLFEYFSDKMIEKCFTEEI